MNKKQIFAKVRERLLDGHGRCTIGDRCVYRRADGNKCAVGALMSDRVYTPDMDNLRKGPGNVAGIIRRFHDRIPKWMKDPAGLLNRLQVLHDNAFYWDGGQFVGVKQFNDILHLEYRGKPPAELVMH